MRQLILRLKLLWQELIAGSAFDITGSEFGEKIAPPGNRKTLTDITATTEQVVSMAFAARWVFVRIYQKAFTAGTGTVSVEYRVRLGSDDPITADVITVGRYHAGRVDEESGHIIGFSALKPLKNIGITRVANGTDAATFDAEVIGVS